MADSIKTYKITKGAALDQILLDHHSSGGPLFNPQANLESK